jgi:hypothetical protein
MTRFSLDASFRHRENLDGTWDSICMRCYATAAHSHREMLLSAAESEHHCDEGSWTFKEPGSVSGISPTPKLIQFPAPGGVYVRPFMTHLSGPLIPFQFDRN